MSQGTVKWFDDAKGYGFIRPDEGGEDLFVHHTGIAGGGGHKSLDEGDRVTYEVVQGRKGMQAGNVSKVSGDGADYERKPVTVPVEVEAAARILVKHFDPNELYEAMVDAAGRGTRNPRGNHQW